MCLENSCDEIICCICASVGALLCCKFCKDRENRTSVHYSSSPPLYRQPTGRLPEEHIYGQRLYHQTPLHPEHYPQPHHIPYDYPMRGNRIPPSHQGYTRHDLPSLHAKQQAVLYK
ncbi:unnamed protein product [Adineta ricciae]|uniref:Uncharacterized protein n=1 Tax=Adineta ricciae TaxID=249248 RepID=A0A813WVS3_ADIRI|nr:unnamed protein product [Adineta ricciae]CAF1185205.1 unnamed protein product [Adineta ricciae]